jgi:hypothetical protein
MSETVEGDSARWDVLRRRIEGLRTVLVSQGSLVTKRQGRNTSWYLRYVEGGPGGRKQRSLYIGGEDDARRVQALIDDIRAPGEFQRETFRLVDLACHAFRPLLRRGNRSGA